MGTHVGGNQRSSKSMVILRDFPYINALFSGLVIHHDPYNSRSEGDDLKLSTFGIPKIFNDFSKWRGATIERTWRRLCI